MSWARVDDQWWCHPKVVGLSLSARGLWVSVLSWCSARGSGEIPTVMLGTLTSGDRRAAQFAEELVAAGLWEVASCGWEIHDFEQFRSPGRVKLSPEQRSEHARKAAQSRWGDAQSNAQPMPNACGEHAVSIAGAMHEQCSTCSPDPIPSRPDPDPPIAPPDPECFGLQPQPTAAGKPGKGRRSKSTPHTIPADWLPTIDVTSELAGAYGVTDDDIRFQAEEFRRYWLHGGGKDEKKADWLKTFRNRIHQIVQNGRRLTRPASAQELGAMSWRGGSGQPPNTTEPEPPTVDDILRAEAESDARYRARGQA